MVTHLEPDIMECEVKCALGNATINKASDGILGDGIPAELSQIIKGDAVKLLHLICQQISNPERRCYKSAALNMPANLENSTVVTGPEKVNFQSNPKVRQCQRMFKLPHDCTHFTC